MNDYLITVTLTYTTLQYISNINPVSCNHKKKTIESPLTAPQEWLFTEKPFKNLPTTVKWI